MVATGKGGYPARCSSCLPPCRTQLLYKSVEVQTLSLGLIQPRNETTAAPVADTDGQGGGLSPRCLPGPHFPALPRSRRLDAGEAPEPAPTIGKGKFGEDLPKPISPQIVAFLMLVDRDRSCPCGGAGGTAVRGRCTPGRKGCWKKKVGAVGTKYTTPEVSFWLKMEQIISPFCGNILKRGRLNFYAKKISWRGFGVNK